MRRNDPPPPLPDKVRQTVHLAEGVDPIRWVKDLNAEEGGPRAWNRWYIVSRFDQTIVIQRDDGAYRWRDDGFKGF